MQREKCKNIYVKSMENQERKKSCNKSYIHK